MQILNAAWRFIKGFGLFWKDFLVGDYPELALGVLIILGIAHLLRNSRAGSIAFILVLVLVTMTLAVWRKTRAHS